MQDFRSGRRACPRALAHSTAKTQDAQFVESKYGDYLTDSAVRRGAGSRRPASHSFSRWDARQRDLSASRALVLLSFARHREVPLPWEALARVRARPISISASSLRDAIKASWEISRSCIQGDAVWICGCRDRATSPAVDVRVVRLLLFQLPSVHIHGTAAGEHSPLGD